LNDKAPQNTGCQWLQRENNFTELEFALLFKGGRTLLTEVETILINSNVAVKFGENITCPT
jgi:hypothetical protein